MATIYLTAPNLSAIEGGQTASFLLSTSEQFLSGSEPTILFYVEGDAVSERDYTATNLTVDGIQASTIFPSGQDTLEIVVTAVDDTVFETSNLTLTLLGQGQPAYDLSDLSTATITIYSDDPAPVISLSQTTATAPEGGQAGVYTFTQDRTADVDIDINFQVSGTATSGSDYTAIGAAITLSAGFSTATLPLSALVDGVFEPAPETAILTLLSGDNYTIGTLSTATISITSTDAQVQGWPVGTWIAINVEDC